MMEPLRSLLVGLELVIATVAAACVTPASAQPAPPHIGVVDASAPRDGGRCAPQDIRFIYWGNRRPCHYPPVYLWDGARCTEHLGQYPLCRYCTGADCGREFATVTDCARAYAGCPHGH
jgi:hypothetical protein